MMLNEEENKHWPEPVMGIDEAGRGPLCGPLLVGAVVFPAFYKNAEINDSKKLSPLKREKLYDIIKHDAVYATTIEVDAATIDKLNIYRATKQAMEKLAMSYPAKYILSDAMPLDIEKEVKAIVHGDALSISIAAASILAKVERDRIMIKYDKLYPMYGFATHKGYPTKKHLIALKEYGILDFYRKTYGPVKELLNNR